MHVFPGEFGEVDARLGSGSPAVCGTAFGVLRNIVACAVQLPCVTVEVTEVTQVDRRV